LIAPGPWTTCPECGLYFCQECVSAKKLINSKPCPGCGLKEERFKLKKI